MFGTYQARVAVKTMLDSYKKLSDLTVATFVTDDNAKAKLLEIRGNNIAFVEKMAVINEEHALGMRKVFEEK
jgi:hypothetical protein